MTHFQLTFQIPLMRCNTLCKNGLTQKKVQRIAKQRSAIHRGDYLAENLYVQYKDA